jgi:hypothetical protein
VFQRIRLQFCQIDISPVACDYQAMRNRSRIRPEKDNRVAHATLQAILDGGKIPRTPDGKNPLAVALGRKGGLKGGKARAESMTALQRSESAKKAANARWKTKTS